MVQLNEAIFYYDSDNFDEMYLVLSDSLLSFTNYRYSRHKIEFIMNDTENPTRIIFDKETHYSIIFKRHYIEKIDKLYYSILVEHNFEVTELLRDIITSVSNCFKSPAI